MTESNERTYALEREVARLRTENEELRSKTAGWDALLDASSDAIVVAEASSGAICEVNDKAADLLGCKRDDLVGLHQKELHPPNLQEEYARIFQQCVKDGGGFLPEINVQHQDGSQIPVEIGARLFRRAGKEYLVGFFHDIRSRLGSRQALSQSQERFEIFFNKANDGMFVYHPQEDGMPSNFFAVNDAGARMMGYSKEELLRLSPMDLTPEDSLNEIPPIVEELKEKGEAVFTLKVRRKDGTVIDIEIHDHLFVYEDRPTVLSLVRDITERLDAERRLKEAEKKLAQTDKMAALGQVVAGVAHEVNNTLNFITGAVPPFKRYLAQLKERLAGVELESPAESAALTKEKLFGKFELLLGNVEEGASRTKKIIHDLQAFSHTEGSDVIWVDVHDTLESTLSLLFHEVQHKIQIIRDYQAKQTKVSCFPNNLSQIFMNVLINALQSIKGSGAIGISTFNDNDTIVVKFKDDGCGVAEELQGKVFDPFFTTKDVGEGTGLGLSITYTYVEKMGGSVEFASQEGQGTEVIITLPVQG